MMVLKHCLAEFGCLFLAMPGDLWDLSWRRKWQPIPVFLPGKFHGQRSLAGYSPWDCKESDTTEKAQMNEKEQNKGHLILVYVLTEL